MLDEYLKLKAEYINEKLEEFLPKNIDSGWLRINFDYDNHPEIINEILRPVWDLLERGGKRWRPVLMMLACDAVGGGAKVEELIPIVEIIHNGTLMVDDVEDNSENRRGKPCTHKLFGVDVAINTGNLMYYLPHLILKRIDLDKKTKLAIYDLIYEEMLNISIGQGMDIYWHNNGAIINEALYLRMCALKTGTLARMSAKLGGLLGNAGKRQLQALGNFAEKIGIAFQIQDDILNVTNKDWGKDFGDDITEGKRSLMVIKALEIANIEDKKRLLSILDGGSRDKKLIDEAISILEKYNTLNYARKMAKGLVEEAWEQINDCLEYSDSKIKLKLFADFLIERNI
ncbi:polyprenyl synthetase family protein [Candidatus Pacearchaeota archaeon]|nr:polyprenyl synthetase family protein [Candidatus Pacearchaeota archaeon]